MGIFTIINKKKLNNSINQFMVANYILFQAIFFAWRRQLHNNRSAVSANDANTIAIISMLLSAQSIPPQMLVILSHL